MTRTSLDENDFFIPEELYRLIRRNNEDELCARLKEMSYVRMALHVMEERDEGYVSLLMLGAFYGYEHFVRALLAWDSTSKHVELSGRVHDANGVLVSKATALWCALERGHYPVAHVLINEGHANVVCDPKDSLLLHFVQAGRLDVVRFLVEETDIVACRRETQSKSYHAYFDWAANLGHTDILIYFLGKGVERDIKMGLYNSYALQQAAKNGRYDCVRVLCHAGLSSRNRNLNGRNTLTLAAENDHLNIVEFLLEYENDGASFDQLELVAASFMTSVNRADTPWRAGRMRPLLQLSLTKRLILNFPKIVTEPIAAYEFHRECQSLDAFDRIQNDNELLHLEALLIRERVLLPHNDPTLLPPLQERGIALVERGEFDRCFQLWLHTFQLCDRIHVDTNLQNFVWLFCQMFTAGVAIRGDQFLHICHLTFHSSQQKFSNKRITAALCLVALADMLLEQNAINMVESLALMQWIRGLCRQRLITKTGGQTLLHLSVSNNLYKYIHFRTEDIKSILIFPNKRVSWLLLYFGRHWIDIDAVDRVHGNTALHGLADREIVELLINAGAHVDCVNDYGNQPEDETTLPAIQALLKLKQNPPQLKCLCARLIATIQQLNHNRVLPMSTSLNHFISLHGARAREDIMEDQDSSTESSNDSFDFDFFG